MNVTLNSNKISISLSDQYLNGLKKKCYRLLKEFFRFRQKKKMREKHKRKIRKEKKKL